MAGALTMWNNLSGSGRALLSCCIESGPQHIHDGHPGFFELQRDGLILVYPIERQWHAVQTAAGFACWKAGTDDAAARAKGAS